jgi:outer membrane protein OmpA-like peptidoglycan-associated protein
MKPFCLNINWAAGATLAAIGGAAISLLQMSACSRSVELLPPEVAPLRPNQTSASVRSFEKVDLHGVQFLGDGSIRPESKAVLDAALELLKDKPNATIYVDAYCDPRGGPKLNQQLSEARAAAAASYLESRGISSERVVPRGFGASNFVASNTTASGRSQNRRIELLVQSGSGLEAEHTAAGSRTENYAVR